MRRHRRIRTGYRSGTKKKPIKAIVIRVLFVIACAAVLVAVSVLLGTYLKDKAARAEDILSSEPAEQTATPESVNPFPDGIPSTSDADKIAVNAAYIDISAMAPAEITDTVNGLSNSYNAVSVNVFDENGQLIYLSEALMSYVGLSTDELSTGEGSADAETKARISALIAACNHESLRTSAMFSAGTAVLDSGNDAYVKRDIDSLILGELYRIGFDEVVITGLVDASEEISYDSLKSIVSYLAHLRKNSEGIDIGVLIPASVYLVPQSASIIKTLSEYVDFLAMSIDTDAVDCDEAYYSVYDDCHSLKGNFSVYNIRGVITSRDPDIAAAVYAALRDLSVSATQFSVYVESLEFVPEHQTVSTEPPASEPIYNDNASRKDDYLETEEAETNAQ